MEYEAIIEAENITEATKLFEKNPFAHVPVGETMGKIVPDKDDVWIERTEVIDYKGQKSPYGCSKK